MRNKINDEFQFPEHIDMSPFKVESLSDSDTDAPPDIFQLVGVLVHSGTAESGHYYSYIRKRPAAHSTGTWVEFNDSDVTSFNPSGIADQCFGGFNDLHHAPAYGQVRFNKVWNAYMLFYERVSSLETAKSIYKPTNDVDPVRVPLPVPLKNHIAMENELFIRTYCLLNPYHVLFVRHLLSSSIDMEVDSEKASSLNKSAIFVSLDTLEQLISRTREPSGLDTIAAEVMRAIGENRDSAYRVLEWSQERPSGLRDLVVRSPYQVVRTNSIKIFTSALAKLQALQDDVTLEDAERELWRVRYNSAIKGTVATLAILWSNLQTISRSWDDYFEFLLLLANLGAYETGVLLDYGFLRKCLEIVWLDRDDLKRLKRQYAAYCRLVEKGRRFSHKNLTDLLYVLLRHIDFTLSLSPDGERIVRGNRYSVTVSENLLIRSFGKNNELLFLKKLLEQYSSPLACEKIVGLFLEAEPEAQLMRSIIRVLEEGLRLAPASLCVPFLDATLVFCKQSPDEERIVAMIDFVAKGVDSISNSGGKEHLAFFSSLSAIHNERIGKDPVWFSSQVLDKIPDWAPTLLIYADKAIRTMTFDLLRHILFVANECEGLGDDWPGIQERIAKNLVRTCIEKLRRTYLSVPGQNVEAKVVETINLVIAHCLETYFGDSEEDQEFIRQANSTSFP